MIFFVFHNQIKSISIIKSVKICNHCAYTQIITKKIYFFSLLYIRMSGKNINFDEKKIEKNDFYKSKKLFIIDDIDVNKILVSKKEPYSIKDAFKYLI